MGIGFGLLVDDNLRYDIVCFRVPVVCRRRRPLKGGTVRLRGWLPDRQAKWL